MPRALFFSTRQNRKSTTLQAVGALILAFSLGGCVARTTTSRATPTPPKDVMDSSQILINGRADFNIDREKWFGNLTAGPMTAQPKDRALIALPHRNRKISYQRGFIKSVENGLASATIDRPPNSEDLPFHNEYSQLPGELVFPVPPKSSYQDGDWVVVAPYQNGFVLGRVLPVKNKETGWREARYHDKALEKKDDDFIYPMTGRIEPLQPVIYPKGSGKRRSYHLGFVALMAGEDAHILEYANNGFTRLVPRDQLTVFKPHPKAFEVGDKVWVHHFGTGFKQGEVKKVVEPATIYHIEIGNNMKNVRGTNYVYTHDLLLKELPAA